MRRVFVGPGRLVDEHAVDGGEVRPDELRHDVQQPWVLGVRAEHVVEQQLLDLRQSIDIFTLFPLDNYEIPLINCRATCQSAQAKRRRSTPENTHGRVPCSV